MKTDFSFDYKYKFKYGRVISYKNKDKYPLCIGKAYVFGSILEDIKKYPNNRPIWTLLKVKDGETCFVADTGNAYKYIREVR